MEEGRNLLDPFAKEFYPSASPQFALPISPIYLPYPPPIPAPPPPYAPPSDASDSPTRALLLTLVPPHADEPEVRASMQLFGGVRAVDMGPQGVATVHFFDLRSAEAALAEVRDQHVRFRHGIQQQHLVVVPSSAAGGPRGLVGGHPVWAQFGRRGVDSPNQGSLFVLVSDPATSADEIRDIFQIFGSVKEVTETPSNPHRKFVEFFDIRDAARALAELNGKEVFGRRLLVEFTKPGTTRGPQIRSVHKRSISSGQQNSLVPPRLRSGGASCHSQSSSSDAGSSGGGGSWNQVGPLGRPDAKISNVVARIGNSGSGRRSKGAASSSKQRQQQLSNSKKVWKNHPNNRESRFLFKPTEGSATSESAAAAASCSRDSRTTVMIKNIPNKYSQKLLLNMLDNHCIHINEQIGEGDDEPFSSYDFVYLPIDFNNKCNVGYGFVNLTTPEATWRLYSAFDNKPWEVFNSRKICQVTYARLQGLEALKEHFKNSKFACDNDEYMPVVFCPPRDGQQLTDPVPIGGQRIKIRASLGDVIDIGGASSTTTSTHAPSEQADVGDDDVSDGDGDLREEFLQLSFDH